MLRKTFSIDFVNLLVGAAVVFVDSQIRHDILMKTESCPDRWTMLWQFFFFLYMEEVLFYVAHRSLHHPSLYFLHKRHHEYKSTISLAYIYSSQAEHVSNVIASGLAFKVLSSYYPVHIFTIIIWLTFRSVESLDGHSGYDWPWAVSNWVPFSASSTYHFFHHSKNIGNYGGICHIVDTLCGTNRTYLAIEAAKEVKEGKEARKDN
jgi:sterol desaturase/sphingolipid hydroxylase (fatty acid hydroxylase superfamily)